MTTLRVGFHGIPAEAPRAGDSRGRRGRRRAWTVPPRITHLHSCTPHNRRAWLRSRIPVADAADGQRNAGEKGRSQGVEEQDESCVRGSAGAKSRRLHVRASVSPDLSAELSAVTI